MQPVSQSLEEVEQVTFQTAARSGSPFHAVETGVWEKAGGTARVARDRYCLQTALLPASPSPVFERLSGPRGCSEGMVSKIETNAAQAVEWNGLAVAGMAHSYLRRDVIRGPTSPAARGRWPAPPTL